MKSQFAALARYNGWANRLVYEAVAGLSPEEFGRDMGAFFRSVKGTLNHLLAADRIWLGRLTGAPAAVRSLDQVLFDDFAALRAARTVEDKRLVAVVDALDPAALDGDLVFSSMMGGEFRHRLADILTHLFNHQTHHRGQVHDLLSQLGRVTPEIDFLFYLRRR